MKRLGQHFLKNRRAIKRIVSALDLRAGNTVIEVGAGHGELTNEVLGLEFDVLDKNKKKNIKIIAIEKDEKLAMALREKFSENKNVEIICGDALKVTPSLAHNPKPETYKLVGNIPYYITGKLLRIIGELKIKPVLCVFTLQKEVAERIAAKPPKMNRLAASVQFWAEAKIIGLLAKKDFEPPPDVESAIITLTLTDAERTRIDAEKYYRAVGMLFAQPRKTVLNNLASSVKGQASKEEIAEKLRKAGVNPNSRPQNLGVDDIVKVGRWG